MMTELEKAISRHDIELVMQLVTDGCYPELSFSVYTAIDYGYHDILQILFEYGWPVDADDGVGGKPLHYVTEDNDIETMELLLDYGADVNSTIQDGVTSLMVAAREGNTKAAKVLLNNGADPNIQNDSCLDTALHLALNNFDKNDSLFSDDDDDDEYDHDRQHKFNGKNPHHKMVRLLLLRGADPYLKNDNGESPLEIAGRLGYSDAMKGAFVARKSQ